MCWAVNCMKNKLVFSEVKKILVIRLDAAGDLILSTPFFRNLRDNFPNAVITALIREYTQGVLVNNPNVDKLLVYPEKSNVLKRINFILSLKKENFDFAVSLSPIAKSFFLSFLVAGKRTFSYSYSGRFTANIIASLLGKCPKLDIAGLLSSGERVPHEVLQTFVILKSLGINPKEYPLEAFPEAASFKFAESILPKLPAIGVHLSFKWLTGGWTEKDLAENHEEEIKKLKQKLERVKELYIDGYISREEFDDKSYDINSRLVQIDADGSAAVIRRNEKLNVLLESDISSIYEKFDRKQKAIFWRNLIDHIVVHKDNSLDIYLL